MRAKHDTSRTITVALAAVGMTIAAAAVTVFQSLPAAGAYLLAVAMILYAWPRMFGGARDDDRAVRPCMRDGARVRPRVWTVAVWAAVTMVIYLSRSPGFFAAPIGDGAVFMYVGKALLNGQTPYRDVFDHKGPLMYLLNAAGLAAGGRWGVWAIESLLIGCGVGLLFHTVHRATGLCAAIVAATLVLYGLESVGDPGDKTECFAIFFHALALWAVCCLPSRGRAAALIIGSCVAACFWLRPNNVGLPAAAAVVLAGVEWRRANWRALATCAARGVGVFVVVGVAIVLVGVGPSGLGAMVDAYVVFNLQYAGDVAWADRYRALLVGFSAVGLPAMLATVGWCMIVVRLARGPAVGRTRPGATARRMMLVCAIAWPIEIAAACVSGYDFRYYYLTWLPTGAAAIASVIHFVRPYVASLRWRGRSLLPGATAVAAMAVYIATFNVSIHNFRRSATHSTRWAHTQAELAPYLHNHTHLLMWGHGVYVNVMLDLPAPGRFPYNFPLLHTAYVQPEMIASERQAIDRTRPLIVDTASTIPWSPPLDPEARARWHVDRPSWGITPEMAAMIDHINRTYKPVATMPTTGWVIYEPIEAGPSAAVDK
ncbi:MAG: hypothetical protein GC159_18415 [Phycisphaera sp.]|nr:hypothetical protein [Phycisphaera sp.]